MKKIDWALNKIATAKTVAELEDEYERGCEIYLSQGRCSKGECKYCPLEFTHRRMMDKFETSNINITVNGTVNITVNGNVIIGKGVK